MHAYSIARYAWLIYGIICLSRGRCCIVRNYKAIRVLFSVQCNKIKYMDTKNVLLGILIIAVFATGFMIGRFSSVGDAAINGSQNNEPTASATNDESDGTVAAESDTTISTSNLTDSQKKMLSALGIDAESIVVTPEMSACADSSLGAARMDEIINGATPSFTEGAKLVACYK